MSVDETITSEQLDQLMKKLDELGFTDNFWALGISVAEALTLDNPSLMRRINEANGAAEEFRQMTEQRNQENNSKLLHLLRSDDFTRITG